MSGTSLMVDGTGLDRLSKRLADLPRKLDLQVGLLDAIGFTVENQTHRRLRDEKTSPAGIRWPEWSDAYAKTRHGGHTLLMGEGNLDDSIQYVVGLDFVEVGSNLVYAAIHQHGGADVGVKIPQREYLGLSEDNLTELGRVVDDYIDERLAAA